MSSSKAVKSSSPGCKFCGFTNRAFGALGHAVRTMAIQALSRDSKHDKNKKLRQGKEK